MEERRFTITSVTTLFGTYAGGSVVFGTLLAKVDAFGDLDMRYQHVPLTATSSRAVANPAPRVYPTVVSAFTNGGSGPMAPKAREVPSSRRFLGNDSQLAQRCCRTRR